MFTLFQQITCDNFLNDNNNSLVAEELRKTIVLLLEGTKSAISPSSLYAVMWKVT